jgi:hypothetical protein
MGPTLFHRIAASVERQSVPGFTMRSCPVLFVTQPKKVTGSSAPLPATLTVTTRSATMAAKPPSIQNLRCDVVSSMKKAPLSLHRWEALQRMNVGSDEPALRRENPACLRER